MLPSGVNVKVDGKNITVSGPKGELKHTIPECTSLEVKENSVSVVVADQENTNNKAMW
jgi:large subunit ribosomal protein L6